MIVKVLNDEERQVIELPKEIRIDDSEVEVKKLGQAIILMPIGFNWDVLQTVHDAISDDFMAEGRAVDIPQEREIFS